MLKVEDIHAVTDYCRVQGQSGRAAARVFQRSRNTIAKVLKEGVEGFRRKKGRRREPRLLLERHQSYIDGVLLGTEGGLQTGNPKAKRGYSRDKRPDCKQIVVALVVNRDGFPLLHEILDGNTQDRSTVGEMLELIDKRVGLRERQTVVVDRGMTYPENLDQIRNHPKKLRYIVATRQSERDQWLDEFEGLDGFEEVIRKPSPRNPFQKKSSVRVKTCRKDSEVYALCISSERIQKDRAIREKQEQRILKDLDGSYLLRSPISPS